MNQQRQWQRLTAAYGAFYESFWQHSRPGGASWARVFGRVLALLIGVQVISGLLLMASYVPSVPHAWSSVFFIQHVMTAGWFIRGLHHHGASAIMIVLGLHLLQTAVYGAYRTPRAGMWYSGLLLMALVMGLALTGYILPWDQKAYWASKVTTSVAGGIPVVGPSIKRMAIAGSDYGQLALSRFYFLHVALLPLGLLAVIAVHFALFSRHGAAPRIAFERKDARPDAPYFPDQFARNIIAAALVLGLVSYFAIKGSGAPLDAPADPSVPYPPRPEWYFRFLFQFLKIMPPRLETLAAVLLPAVAAAYLVALPRLDTKANATVIARARWWAPMVLAMVGVVVLTGWSLHADLHDEEYLSARALADDRAARAVHLAKKGIPEEGPVAMLARDPLIAGGDVYRAQCLQCHVLDGEGEREAPDHTVFASREWILALLHDPQDERFFGTTELDDMPSQSKLGEENLLAITEYLYSLAEAPQESKGAAGLVQVPRRIVEGERLFHSKCLGCHVLDGEGDFKGIGGPDLTGYASVQWILKQTANPESIYGELNEMPSFAEELSEHELRMVSEFVFLQRTR